MGDEMSGAVSVAVGAEAVSDAGATIAETEHGVAAATESESVS